MDLIPFQSQVQIPLNTPASDATTVRSWLRSKRSPHTLHAYSRDIDAFYAFVNKPLREVTLEDVQDYAERVIQAYPSIETQRRMLYAVKSLLTFAQKQGYIPFNVGSSLLPPKGKDELANRILSRSQIERILYEAEKSASQRDYVLILLLYASGIRCEEVCNLQWKDVKEREVSGQITVFGKERSTRAVILHIKAWEALLTIHPKEVSEDEYVFASRQTSIRQGLPSRRLTESRVWQIVHGIAERAGIKASPHFFRHAHATQAMGKVPQPVIMKTLGWKSHRTIARYQHVLPDDSSSLVLEL